MGSSDINSPKIKSKKSMNIEKKINILFVLPNFDTGGSEKLVVDLG